MSEQYLTMVSVAGWQGQERYYAIVPERETAAIARVRADDPVWNRADAPIMIHWSHRIDPVCHVRVRNRAKFQYKLRACH